VRELDRLKKEWQEGSRYAPYHALFCLNRAKKIPDWIMDAFIPELQNLLQEEMKKRGSRRYRQHEQDKNIYSSVLDFRRNGLTWERAYERAAETAGVYDGTELNRDRVHNAYVRVRRQVRAGKLKLV